ncbi:MAG: S41 family peptidase [Bacteroidales bacterium]|jgi:carboxyl-terminal processing protease|nr:S41 family peptidase [Bacteroidales bacterium]MDI9592481.1 S41 family peptidase [Bacteroidota bacterium]NLH32943.1 S41 family peptidase [Lentimicrobium sp.]OQC38262.1 MAG: Carboxy-terminal processing protease CtpB precursor [Bacteroidetes bacterium ADurb.Bin041]MBP7873515.1 S41 family peptidase [Bacteroidales bacterium]
MSNFKHKITIYLPILFALVLIFGIIIGIRLVPRDTVKGNIFSVDFSKYSKVGDVLRHIKRDWVDTVNLEKLEEDAIIEILENLDPHSQYISANEFDQANEYLEGNFEGIGVQFRIEKDTAMVIIPIAGGPSDKVGVKAGDRIVIVDGDTVVGSEITSENIMKRLKGKKNTKVNIQVFRRGESQLLEFNITRGVIPTYSLDIAYMIDANIGYIKLSKFSSTTSEEFSDALSKLLNEGMTKLILDLRNNAGGYLQAAIDVADEFLVDKQLIVYTEGKNRATKYAFATKKGKFEQEPVIILIDEGSASASEIVAGAIQDNDRGIIIGRRSFGKGLVQEQITLFDGSAIRLTTARYYTPTGRSIQKPYGNGREEYFNEFHQRFVNGEVFHADSIHFDDSLKFFTKKGKIVYGGGGIMPDIYIPIRNAKELVYYNRLIGRGLIYDFALDYTDANRNSLNQYDNLRKFADNFKVSEAMFNDLISYADSQGLERDTKSINAMKEDIKALLKALIGRNILDNEGFYPTFNEKDEILQEAIRQFKKII